MCTVVVGAAIVDRGRVLAARRGYPPALAGRWELPGGKVDPGEGEEDALIRECREELDVEVRPVRRLDGQWRVSRACVLRVWVAAIAGGVPRAREHTRLRWLGAGELDDVPWLQADLPLLPRLRGLLQAR